MKRFKLLPTIFAVLAVLTTLIGTIGTPLSASSEVTPLDSRDTLATGDLPGSAIDAEIDAILASGKAAFVFFYAEWCHYCQQEKPIIDALEQLYAEEVSFIRIDGEANPEAYAEFGVTGYPTMFLIAERDAGGQYVNQRFGGFTDEVTLQRAFDYLLASGELLESAVSGGESDTCSSCASTQASAEPFTASSTPALTLYRDGRNHLIAQSSSRIFCGDDQDDDGLSDDWENAAIDRFRPYIILDENEDYMSNYPSDKVYYLARATPYESGDVEFVLFVFVIAWTRDYGRYCDYDACLAHWGDAERVEMLWQVLDDWTVDLIWVYTASHEGEDTDHSGVWDPYGDWCNQMKVKFGFDQLQCVNGIKFTEDNTWVIYAAEDKHGSYVSYDQCNSAHLVSLGMWPLPTIGEDCGGGWTIRPPAYNVGEEPPNDFLDCEIGYYLFPPGGDCVWTSDGEFCGGGPRDGDCASSILSKLGAPQKLCDAVSSMTGARFWKVRHYCQPLLVGSYLATDVDYTSATLNGKLTSLSSAPSVTVSFEWGPNAGGPYPNETASMTMTSPGDFHFDLEGLSPGTMYFFRAKAVAEDFGTGYSMAQRFDTWPTRPLATTNDASYVTSNSARLNGRLTWRGTASSITVSFEWGTTPGGPYPNHTPGQVMINYGEPFYFDLDSLTPGTTYYYRAWAVGDGTGYGYEKSFTTLPAWPLVTTNDANNVITNSARLNGSLTSLGDAGSVMVSFVWRTAAGEPYPNETPGQVMTAPGPFEFELGGLTPGMTYYFQAKSVGRGTSYGAEESFTTTTVPPSVTTDGASQITPTSVRLNSNLLSLGTAGNATVSFVWGTTAGGPYPNETPGQVMTAPGPFYFDLDSLTPLTTYYFQAKGAGDGTGYGLVKKFNSASKPPSVSTLAATDISGTTAILNGEVTDWGLYGYVAVSAGQAHSLGIRSDGSLWAWGGNYRGELGLGDNTDRLVPNRVGSDSDWVAVSAGYYHSIGLRSDGTLWAWGLNEFGQLGLGDKIDRLVPNRVGSDSDWVAVSAGGAHSLGLRSDGTLWAWGLNAFGQLGLDNCIEALAPTRVGSDNDWVAVSAGLQHSLGLRSDGTLWAWGWNEFGQLGLGDYTDMWLPTRVGSDSDWVAVSAATNHSLGVCSDGSLWAWGDNTSGQLGLGDSGSDTQRLTPNLVGFNWVAASAGGYFSLGLQSDGGLWSWGSGYGGRLGLGDSNPRNVPNRIGSDSNWAAASAGGEHSLGLHSDGTLWAWGRSADGQLGLGNVADTFNPTQVSLSPLSRYVSFEWGLTTAYGNTAAPQSVTSIGGFYSHLSGLTVGTTYHFRAKVVGDITAYGADMTFRTADDMPPPIPTIVSPVDRTNTKENRPALDWSDVTDPSGVYYWYQIDDNSDFSSLILGGYVVPSEYTVESALGDGLYYWRVCSADLAGNASDWTSTQSFGVDTAAPPMPTLLSLGNGTTVNDSTPTLDWSDVTDPSGAYYWYQIDDNSDFSSLVLGGYVVPSEYTVEWPLADGTYYWRVCSADLAGNVSGWTAAWSFTVPTWDINNDGKIDYKDLAILGAHYGETTDASIHVVRELVGTGDGACVDYQLNSTHVIPGSAVIYLNDTALPPSAYVLNHLSGRIRLSAAPAVATSIWADYDYMNPDTAWDINRDGKVDYKDLAILGAHYGEVY